MDPLALPTASLDPFALAGETLDPYAERILEAGRALLLEHGLRRTSLADIARAAGVSEATLFRRFANRGELLLALVAREAHAFIARVDERVSRLEDPEEGLVTGFLVFARALREHELIQRLLETDPETILPLLTTAGAPLLELSRRYLTAQALAAQDAGVRLTADPEYVAELLTRIAHSLMLTPSSVLPLDDDEALAVLARATLARLVLAADPPHRQETT